MVKTGESAQSQSQGMKRQRAARASRACRTCRKQKTRCFPSNTRSCLRCQTLALDCSFLENEYEANNDPVLALSSSNNNNAGDHDSLVNSDQLTTINHNVKEILDLLKTSPSTSAPTYSSMMKKVSPPLMESPSFGLPSMTFITSPFNTFGSLTSPPNHPLPISRLYNPQMVVHDQDIISLGLISETQALELMTHFRANYNRWVSFPEDIPIEGLVDRIRRRCSLLLTVCCCVSIRFYDQDLRTKVYKLLLRKMQTELHQSFIVVPQTIEFMQALAVMSIYSASLSDGDIVIDGWFYSSLALQHFVTKDVLGLVMSFDGIGPVTEFDEITAYRVWNHLCLIHLVSCVMTGRMCILDENRLELCRRTLDLSSATNFDGRMIAEISLHLIIYNCIEGIQPLHSVERDFSLWKEEWGYLFEQPNFQFTESTYHYGYYLVLFHWNYIKTTANSMPVLVSGSVNTNQLDQTLASCDQDTLKQMAHHLIQVIDGLLAVNDTSFFSYLSDEVHFCGAYAAVMLTRLLYNIQAYGRMVDINVQRCLTKINSLEVKFRTVIPHEDDLLARLAGSISENLAALEQG
uniref:ARAD1C42636p n=1 Tax=Blastobotrys adeninivorans TaxID=409370 RepID=A0A060TA57_BLAAD